MTDRSTYEQFIKNEMRKVRAVGGIRCAFAPLSNNYSVSEEDCANTELLKQVLIDNGNCAEVGEPGEPYCEIMDRGIPFYYYPEEQLPIQAGSGERRRHTRRDYRYYECEPYQEYYEWLHRLEYPVTNVYKFVNQNLRDNLLGRSNIDVTSNTYTNNENALKEAQIEQVLKRYGRK